MKKIITFGEILLRLSTSVGERINQASSFDLHYGGAEANVGISLANFGYDVYFVSKIPENLLGSGAEAYLKSKGIKTKFLIRGGRRLGLYFLEAGTGERQSQIIYDRYNSSVSQLKIEELNLEEIFENADFYHISGVTPALSPELRELTILSLKKAKEKGVKTSFDFNYRTKLWSQAKAGAEIKSFLPYIDICSCNELDAVNLLGIKKVKQSFVPKQKLTYYYEKITELYPNIQVLFSTVRNVISSSNNQLQGYLYMNKKIYKSRKHNINPIVDRIGSGDAFISGIIAGLLEEKEPQEIINFGTTTAALKHTIKGDASDFTIEEINTHTTKKKNQIQR